MGVTAIFFHTRPLSRAHDLFLLKLFFSFSFSFTCRIYPLGFTYKKITRSSCKITSMIYTSNCILSKVVSEASVGPLPSSIYCPPMSSLIKIIFSFVSFFFSTRVTPALTPAMAVIPALIRARSHLRSPAPFLHSQTRHHPQRGAHHPVTGALLSGAHRV